MTPLDAAVAEFQNTILNLSARLADMAGAVADLQNQNAALAKELADLKKPPIVLQPEKPPEVAS